MNGLSPTARALIDAAREAESPSQDAARKARVLAALSAQLAIGGVAATAEAAMAVQAGGSAAVGASTGATAALVPTAALAPTAALVPTAATIAVVGKSAVAVSGLAKLTLALGLIGGGAVTGGLAWRASHGDPRAVPVVAAPSSTAPAQQVATVTPIVVDRAIAPPSPEVVPPAPPTVGPTRASTGPAPASKRPRPVVIAPKVASAQAPVLAPAVVQAPTAVAVSSTLTDERALLASATAAIRQGEHQAALTALRTHARRFPDGVLREERMASLALLLCRAGDDASATRAVDAFIAAYPSSPHVGRVQGACRR